MSRAVSRVLRKAGFFPWGPDSWCHDLGVGVVTTAQALDLLYQDERIASEFARNVLPCSALGEPLRSRSVTPGTLQ